MVIGVSFLLMSGWSPEYRVGVELLATIARMEMHAGSLLATAIAFGEMGVAERPDVSATRLPLRFSREKRRVGAQELNFYREVSAKSGICHQIAQGARPGSNWL
jgi:hypothetical protein